MAKRLVDTAKFDKLWFRKLSPKLKVAWEYLCLKCDHAGVWSIDMGVMSMQVGETITEAELESAFGERLRRVDTDKFFVPAFITFQYGALADLNPANKVHCSVLKRLQSLGIETHSPSPSASPSASPLVGAKEKEKEKEKDTDTEKDRRLIALPFAADPRTFPVDASEIAQCAEIWGETLTVFGINKEPSSDQFEIARLLQTHGFTNTKLALLGVRFEAKTEKFDPKQHVSIRRLRKPDLFEKFVNLGAREDVAPKKSREWKI